MYRKRVVITGMGTINAIGKNTGEYWNSLQKGISGVKDLSFQYNWGERKIRGAAVPNEFIEMSHLGDRYQNLSNCIKFLLIAGKEALIKSYGELHSEYNMDIIVGTALGGIDRVEKSICKKDCRKLQASIEDYYLDKAAKYVKSVFHINGFTQTISTTCSSGANALGIAFQYIAYGKKKQMLVGGTECLSYFIVNGLRAAHAMSFTEMKPFDRNRDGMTIGEGAGVMILEELESALERNATIYGEIEEYISVSEAYHLLVPKMEGDVVSDVLNKMIEHKSTEHLTLLLSGNGVKHNDSALGNGVTVSFPENRPYVSGIKPLLGHTLGASGIIEGIGIVKALQNDILFPVYGLEECEFDLLYKKEVSHYSYEQCVHVITSFGGNIAAIRYKKWR